MNENKAKEMEKIWKSERISGGKSAWLSQGSEGNLTKSEGKVQGNWTKSEGVRET